MSNEVLYRKWRPRTFAELVGQDAIVRTLTNALAGDKVAHAYLFSGPRGTGKTTTGRLLAKALNCTQPQAGEPCNACESCQTYLDGRALDLVELDAASNRGIDEIRSLREKANFAPTSGPYKTYLVDEVHMLTEPAFNALLKTLEEPPGYVVFVLATTEAHKVPATISSRCQRFDFRRLPLAAMVERLSHICGEEKIDCPPEALQVIARTATGSARDAINLLQQLADSYGTTLTLEQVREGLDLVVDPRSAVLSAHALRGELAEGLAVIATVRDDGIDLRQFQRQVVGHLRGLLLTKAGASASELWSEEQIAEMRSLVSDVPAERVVATLRAFGEADLRADPLSPLPLELALATVSLAASAPASATPQVAPAPQPPAKQADRPKATAKQDRRPRAAAKAEAVPAKQEPTPKPQAPVEAQAAGGRGKAKPGEQPASAGAAAAATNGDASPLLADVRSHWNEIYQRTRELSYQTGALLNSGCDIIQASEEELVFGFRHQMHLDRIQANGGESLRLLQQAVDEVLGKGRQVRCVLEPNVQGQRLVQSGHLVRAAEEAGGQVVGDGG